MSASFFHIRTLHHDDLGAVHDLLNRFNLSYACSALDSLDLYKSRGIPDGLNSFCAFTIDGQLVGVALLQPDLVFDGQLNQNHVVRANIWVDPGAEAAGSLREALLGCVEERSQDLIRHLPLRKTCLIFQKDPAEEPMIDFLLSMDFVHTESMFHLNRDLTRPIEPVLAPPGMKTSPWRMTSVSEQASYLEARKLCDPESPLTLKAWQDFLHSPTWKAGTCLAVFDGQDLAGSILLFWEEGQNNHAGRTDHLFVLPRWHGLNLGRYLVAQGLQYLRKRGLREAQLEVRAVNAGTLGLYTQMGYQISRESLFLVKTL